MFSRNEKYGNALHLPYGFEASSTSTNKVDEKGFFQKVKAYFTNLSEIAIPNTEDAQLEFSFDKKFLEQSVSRDLRNTDAAANENGPVVIREEIA